MPKPGGSGSLFLHLRLEPHHPWKPHTAFPHLCVPDYPVPGGSIGWATSQKLMRAGWELVKTREPIEAETADDIMDLVDRSLLTHEERQEQRKARSYGDEKPID